jgi:two-component system cell cycle response regulator
MPVVLVTALDGRADRIQGLEAGASDFLTKPIDDVMLFARVRSLTRFKLVIDELRQREASGRRMGVIAGAASRLDGLGGRVLVVDDNERQAQRVMPPNWPSSIARSSNPIPSRPRSAPAARSTW